MEFLTWLREVQQVLIVNYGWTMRKCESLMELFPHLWFNTARSHRYGEIAESANDLDVWMAYQEQEDNFWTNGDRNEVIAISGDKFLQSLRVRT